MFWRIEQCLVSHKWRAVVVDNHCVPQFQGIWRIRRGDAIRDLALYLGEEAPDELTEFDALFGTSTTKKGGKE